MVDLFEKCREYTLVDEAKRRGIYPYFHALDSAPGDVVLMEGKRRIMLGSNNYLGLTDDPRVKEAAIKAIEKYGTGCSGSRFLNGTLDIHLELERELASFLNKEDACLFSTGFQSNLAIISAVTNRHDIILTDARNHASIVDGCRLTFAKVYKYRHSDMEHLEQLLARHAESTKGGILIVTDGVFSMEGDICKLPEIVRLAREYGARVLVDDAHSIGVIGEGGRGTASYFGLEDEVDLIMNTFSKTLASLGGAVVGDSETVNYIRHIARPFIFSASIPPAQVAAAREALQILIEEPERPLRLNDNARYMRERLGEIPHLRIRDGGAEMIPIIPIRGGDIVQTLTMATKLYDAGVYVNPVMPPAVPENDCLLRSSYTATHTREILDEAVDIIARVFATLPHPSEYLDD